MVLRDKNNSPAICGSDRCVDSTGSGRSPAAVSADAPGTVKPLLRQLHPKRMGLTSQVS
jgi:hypothetical protein